MLKVKDYYNAIDKIAPFRIAESFDNVGLLVGDMDDSAKSALLALDVTSKVIEEAKENNVDLIISHHPIMFSAIKRLSSKDLVYKLAQSNIALISAHTNLDSVSGGVNDVLADLLELDQVENLAERSEYNYYKLSVYVPVASADKVYNAIKEAGGGTYGNYSGCAFFTEGQGSFMPLEGANPTIGEINKFNLIKEIKIDVPAVAKENLDNVIRAVKKAHPYEEPSFEININHSINYKFAVARVGTLKKPMNAKTFAEFIKSKISTPGVKYTDNCEMISKVVLCSGSGGMILEDVIKLDADAFLTGELKHDLILKANEAGISTFEAGHFATETIIMPRLKLMIEKEIKNAKIIVSKTCTDGIKIV